MRACHRYHLGLVDTEGVSSGRFKGTILSAWHVALFPCIAVPREAQILAVNCNEVWREHARAGFAMHWCAAAAMPVINVIVSARVCLQGERTRCRHLTRKSFGLLPPQLLPMRCAACMAMIDQRALSPIGPLARSQCVSSTSARRLKAATYSGLLLSCCQAHASALER